MPSFNFMYVGCENLGVGFYFMGLVFVVYESTVQIGAKENFPLYSMRL